MRLKSLDGCKLAIGSYPSFSYNAFGGGGVASIGSPKRNNYKYLCFDSDDFSIPSLNWRTTRILGIPLFPGLLIEMNMEKLEGTLNQNDGEINFQFDAKFIFSIFHFITFPHLSVSTCLSSRRAFSNTFDVQGSPLNKEGRATLVGIAIVPATQNKLLDSFLGLPSEALAVLECELK